MRILIINSTLGYGSTGKICQKIAENYIARGDIVAVGYGRFGSIPKECKNYGVKIGSRLSVLIHALETRVFDSSGFGSRHATKKFLKFATKFNPDIVWLHNLHGYYINIDLLFTWIKSRPTMVVKWTLHDCWAFTGHCTHYSFAQCYKWKTICESCPQKNQYPKSILFDRSKYNFLRKKPLFSNVNNMTLYVPSFWMKDQVSSSFLKSYSIEVLPNTVDKNIFHKVDSTKLRESLGASNKIVVLAVASVWNARKGLFDLPIISSKLPSSFLLIVIGLSKRQKRLMPNSVLCIPRISDQTLLAEYYSLSKFFINPSREESFGLTTLEAALCGAKPIVYSGTASDEVTKSVGGVSINPDPLVMASTLLDLSK